MNLLCGHSEPYSQTWPASGSMRNGRSSERPMSAPPTSVSGSFSSPGLPTPRARDARGRGFSDQLPNIVQLLPTPTVSEANGIGHAADGGMNLRHTVSLLPTPRASENENRQTKRSPSQEAGTHGKCLAAEVAHLLPTPTATPYGNNQSPSPGAAVRPSLDSLAPTLLPTPTATDAKSSSGANPAWGHGVTLTDAARLLLPTTRATDGTKGGPNQRGSKGDLMLPSAVNQMSSGASTSPLSDGGSESSDGPLPGQLTIADA